MSDKDLITKEQASVLCPSCGTETCRTEWSGGRVTHHCPKCKWHDAPADPTMPQVASEPAPAPFGPSRHFGPTPPSTFPRHGGPPSDNSAYRKDDADGTTRPDPVGEEELVEKIADAIGDITVGPWIRSAARAALSVVREHDRRRKADDVREELADVRSEVRGTCVCDSTRAARVKPTTKENP